MFTKIDGKTPKVFINTAGLNSTVVIKDQATIIKQTVRYIDILEYVSKLNNLAWPLVIDFLADPEKNYPAVLMNFLIFFKFKIKGKPIYRFCQN